MSEERTQRRLAAILSADAVDYSRLMRADEETTVIAIKRAREVFAREITSHNGHVIDAAGDNLLAEFSSAVDAVQCALAVQQALATLNTEAAPERRMSFRIGINLGDVIADGETIYGDGVNVAARLQALAEPGGIRISGEVYNLVRDKLDLGYEFTGRQSVKNIDTPIPVYRIAQGPVRPLTALAQRIRTRTGAYVLTAVAVAGLIAGGMVWLWPADNKNSVAPPSIVVLPFENLSDDPKQEFLADGITEDIITDLSRLSNLLVIASNTSFTYKGKKVSPEKVGSDLDVGFVLKGSIRRLGNEVRVNAQLVNTKTGFNTWAQRYDRTVSEVFAVQDEVTHSIVEALAVKITSKEKSRLAQRATNNLQAYDFFQEGQKIFIARTKETDEQARELYQKAIELDPNYGRAYGALATILASNFQMGRADAPIETLDHALVLAKKAVALDESTPQTYWALSFVYLMRKEYELAEKAATQSINIAPNYADGYGLLALIKLYLGKPQEAIDINTKGMRLNPYYTFHYLYTLGSAYYMLGDYDAAIATLEKAHERNLNAVQVKLFLAASYVKAGRQDDAEWMAHQLQMLSPTATITGIDKTIPMANIKFKRALLEDLRKAGLPE
jgi:adenylate cyclase